MKRLLVAVCLIVLAGDFETRRPSAAGVTPAPLLQASQAVDWWFVFKFNAGSFPKCGSPDTRSCPFGGTAQAKYANRFGQQFAFASSADRQLKKGTGCAGDTSTDPVG